MNPLPPPDPAASPAPAALPAPRPHPLPAALAAAFLGGALLFHGIVVLPEALAPGAGWDFRQFYIIARTLLAGKNPYVGAEADAVWARSGIPLARLVVPGLPAAYGTVYPPIKAAVFAPLALLPYEPARLLWLALSYALLVALLLAALHRFAADLSPPRRACVAALVLLLDPVAACLISGQDALLACAAAWAAAVALEHGRPRRAGLLFALAGVKFTCVLLVPLALLWRDRRRALPWVAWAAAATLALNLLPVLVIGPAAWLAAFRESLRLYESFCLIDDPGSILGSYNMVSLTTLLYRLIGPHAPALIEPARWGAIAALLAATAWVLRPAAPRPDAGPLLAGALPAAGPDAAPVATWVLLLCLLVFNHRLYDAVALIPAVPLLAAAVAARRLGLAPAALAAAALFLFLFPSPFESAIDPADLTAEQLWLTLSYRKWAVLALGFLTARAALRSDARGGSGTEPQLGQAK
ncbi:MAG: DUF2029 domain-containing protein [Planctomycetes bacterium]|nr:DUF2029 domain-containing protein [Planctomycetota bacterium]